jgi:hypothetical protein
MPGDNPPGERGQPEQIDRAETLVDEFAQWFSNLGAQGVVPRAFTGLKRDGRQFVTILSGIPFDYVKRRDFLIWLCRREDVVAYAYGTHVAVADDKCDPPEMSEAVDIYAPSPSVHVAMSMTLIRFVDGKITYRRGAAWRSPTITDGQPFLGLHTASDAIDDASTRSFEALWQELGKHALWRDR